tara:strand:- start:181 stop:477 length:297 start_codon:yes stop_codon:yes gene_type:complete
LVSKLYPINVTKKKINKLRRIFVMGRPAKIDEPTKTYSLLMSVKQYDRLSVHSERLQKKSREQVAVSDLMREAIDIYLEALDDDDYDGGVGSVDSDGN